MRATFYRAWRAVASLPVADVALLLVVALVSAIAGMKMLDGWRGPAGSLTNELFIPSVMLASGKGFTNVQPAEVPGLGDFLNFERPAFPADGVPESVAATELHVYQAYHRYLLYLVGGTWRLLGVSWDAMKYLIAAMLAVTACVVYGLFRLGMGHVLSAAGALLFVHSPAVGVVLHNIRDFSKAPFILATILVLGHLAKGAARLRAFLAMSVLLGVIQGIGLGFRRDMAICLPASLLVLMLCSRGERGLAVRERLAAIALMVSFLAVTAWPVARTFGDEGTLVYHDTLMGMSTACDDDAEVRRASYERMYMLSDMMVSLTAIAHADRGARASGASRGFPFSASHTFAEVRQAKKQLLIELVATFPADMIARAYAAVLRILGGVRTLRGPERFAGLFVLCAVATLVTLSFQDARRAWAVLLLLLYFCGYTSIQFNFRHCFHLSFVPYWFGGCMLSMSFHAAKGGLANGLHGWRELRVRGALCFCAGSAVLLAGPLLLSQAHQRHSAGWIAEQCESAELVPLQTRERALDDWVLFRPSGLPACLSCVRPPYEDAYLADCLVAEFESNPEHHHFWVRYETNDPSLDFSHALNYEPAGPAGRGRVKYFFPIYESSRPDAWSRFAGIALPKEHAGTFKGLYRVADPAGFPLLLNVSLPDDTALFRHCQGLGLPGQNPNPHYWAAPYATGPGSPLWQAAGLKHNGELDAAIDAYRDILALDPANVAGLVGLGEALAAKGEIEAAREVYVANVVANPEDPIAYANLDAFLTGRGDPGDRVVEWRAAARDLVQHACPHFYLGMALEAEGDARAAAEAYGKAAELRPAIASMHAAHGNMLQRSGQYEQSAEAFRQALSINPEIPGIRPMLVMALRELGQHEAAEEEIAQCVERGIALPAQLLEAEHEGGP